MTGRGGEGDRERRTGAAAPVALVLTSLVVLAAIATDALPWLRGPAPYPPEWQWAYRPGETFRPLVPAALVAAMLMGLIGISEGGGRRFGRRTVSRALLVAASLGGLVFGVALFGRESPGGLQAMRQRARSFSVTSYHTVAVSEAARDPRAFLEAHAELLPSLARTAPHAATHPPGPVLWYRAALSLCEWSPGLTGALLAVSAAPVPEGQPSERRAVRASALLGALGLAVLASLTVWPLARLGEGLGLSPLVAAQTAAAFTLLPGPALFAGSLDAALALPVSAAAALLLRSTRSPSRSRAALAAIAAGLCGGLALSGSYGAAVFLAAAGFAAVAAGTSRRTLGRAVAVSLAAAAVTALLAFGLPLLMGHEPLRAMRTALALHRTEYTAPRSYALWLVFNPIDFALFAGLPVAVVALWRARGAVGRAREGGRADPLDRFRIATVAGLLLLVASGLTRGEVGRIWIPLVPLVLLASAEAEENPRIAGRLLPPVLAAAFTLAIGRYWSF